jgi:hypothetical protein
LISWPIILLHFSWSYLHVSAKPSLHMCLSIHLTHVSVDPLNTCIFRFTQHMYLLIHSTHVSVDPLDTCICCSIQHMYLLVHSTHASVDPLDTCICCSTQHMYLLVHSTHVSVGPLDTYICWSTWHMYLLIHSTHVSFDSLDTCICWSLNTCICVSTQYIGISFDSVNTCICWSAQHISFDPLVFVDPFDTCKGWPTTGTRHMYLLIYSTHVCVDLFFTGPSLDPCTLLMFIFLVHICTHIEIITNMYLLSKFLYVFIDSLHMCNR